MISANEISDKHMKLFYDALSYICIEVGYKNPPVPPDPTDVNAFPQGVDDPAYRTAADKYKKDKGIDVETRKQARKMTQKDGVRAIVDKNLELIQNFFRPPITDRQVLFRPPTDPDAPQKQKDENKYWILYNSTGLATTTSPEITAADVAMIGNILFKMIARPII